MKGSFVPFGKGETCLAAPQTSGHIRIKFHMKDGAYLERHWASIPNFKKKVIKIILIHYSEI